MRCWQLAVIATTLGAAATLLLAGWPASTGNLRGSLASSEGNSQARRLNVGLQSSEFAAWLAAKYVAEAHEEPPIDAAKFLSALQVWARKFAVDLPEPRGRAESPLSSGVSRHLLRQWLAFRDRKQTISAAFSPHGVDDDDDADFATGDSVGRSQGSEQVSAAFSPHGTDDDDDGDFASADFTGGPKISEGEPGNDTADSTRRPHDRWGTDHDDFSDADSVRSKAQKGAQQAKASAWFDPHGVDDDDDSDFSDADSIHAAFDPHGTDDDDDGDFASADFVESAGTTKSGLDGQNATSNVDSFWSPWGSDDEDFSDADSVDPTDGPNANPAAGTGEDNSNPEVGAAFSPHGVDDDDDGDFASGDSVGLSESSEKVSAAFSPHGTDDDDDGDFASADFVKSAGTTKSGVDGQNATPNVNSSWSPGGTDDEDFSDADSVDSAVGPNANPAAGTGEDNSNPEVHAAFSPHGVDDDDDGDFASGDSVGRSESSEKVSAAFSPHGTDDDDDGDFASADSVEVKAGSNKADVKRSSEDGHKTAASVDAAWWRRWNSWGTDDEDFSNADSVDSGDVEKYVAAAFVEAGEPVGLDEEALLSSLESNSAITAKRIAPIAGNCSKIWPEAQGLLSEDLDQMWRFCGNATRVFCEAKDDARVGESRLEAAWCYKQLDLIMEDEWWLGALATWLTELEEKMIANITIDTSKVKSSGFSNTEGRVGSLARTSPWTRRYMPLFRR